MAKLEDFKRGAAVRGILPVASKNSNRRQPRPQNEAVQFRSRKVRKLERGGLGPSRQ